MAQSVVADMNCEYLILLYMCVCVLTRMLDFFEWCPKLKKNIFGEVSSLFLNMELVLNMILIVLV